MSELLRADLTPLLEHAASESGDTRMHLLAEAHARVESARLRGVVDEAQAETLRREIDALEGT